MPHVHLNLYYLVCLLNFTRNKTALVFILLLQLFFQDYDICQHKSYKQNDKSEDVKKDCNYTKSAIYNNKIQNSN